MVTSTIPLPFPLPFPFPLTGLGTPTCLIITPDGTRVYVANSARTILGIGIVSVIDVASDTVIDSITVSEGPQSIAITPDGKQIYLACDPIARNTVAVVDTTTNTATTIIVGVEPTMVGITPDQAPLARFTQSIQGIGLPSTFNASASVSPTGTIANYFWDFGDGNTLNTTNPVVMHTYTLPGTYTVILIVTNTAGTSLAQLFNYSSFTVFSEFGPSVPLTNNGGPTATTRHSFVVGIVPPSDIVGSACKNKFASQTDCVKFISFSPSPSLGVTSYSLRRNGILIQIIPAFGPFSYEDHGRCNSTDVYTVTAVNAAGQESEPITVIIN